MVQCRRKKGQAESHVKKGKIRQYMRTSLRNHIVFIATFFATCIADQVTKLLILKYAENGILPIRILSTGLRAARLESGNILSLILYKNTGIAFSIPLPETVIIPLIAILIIFGGFFLRKEIDLTRPAALVSLGLILGGALGNLLDRMRLGYVVDFVSVWIFPVFNIADAAITIGILLLILKAHVRTQKPPLVHR